MKRSLLERCLQIARQYNSPNRHPQWGYYLHYSFVIQHGKLLGFGMNRAAPPLTHLGYATTAKVHSETEAIRNCRYQIDFNSAFSVINIRCNTNGALRMSKPCRCCYQFLIGLGCNKVLYSTDRGFLEI